MKTGRLVTITLLKAMLSGIVLGFTLNVYYAWPILSRSRVFEQVSIGLSKEATVKILLDNQIRCGISTHQEDSCWFSDFWRDYQIGIDSGTQTVNRLSYIRRKP